jgi:hypothetical protein
MATRDGIGRCRVPGRGDISDADGTPPRLRDKQLARQPPRSGSVQSIFSPPPWLRSFLARADIHVPRRWAKNAMHYHRITDSACPVSDPLQIHADRVSGHYASWG